MKSATRTIGMKLATIMCLVVLVIAVRLTGALRPMRESGAKESSAIVSNTPEPVTVPVQNSDKQNTTDASKPIDSTSPTTSIVPSATTTSTQNNTTISSGSTQSISGGSTGSTGSGGSTGGSSPPPPTPVTYMFRNGSYTAIGSYSTPGGTQSLNVTLIISNDTVTDSTVTGNATSQPSKNYQQDFIANYRQYVVGKKIDQLSLSKISGSSLTPIGFNNAVDSIENQARI